jgi:hypothetical protein
MNTLTQQAANHVFDVLKGRFTAGTSTWKENVKAKEYLDASKETALRVHISGVEQAIAWMYGHNADADGMLLEDITSILSIVLNTSQPPLDAIRAGGLRAKVLYTDLVGLLCEFVGLYLTGAEVKGAKQ